MVRLAHIMHLYKEVVKSRRQLTENTDINQPPDLTGFRWKPVRSSSPELALHAVFFPASIMACRIATLALFGVYLYAPYSLAVSTIAWTFSGLAWSKNAPLLMMKPPPLPAVSMSFLA
jgi:hypothetical protein